MAPKPTRPEGLQKEIEMKSKGNGSTKGSKTEVVSADLEKQREYAKRMSRGGFDFSLVVGDAFVRGIRDIGYKHTGTALDELIDNAIQAEAGKVHVVFGFGGDSEKKPDRLAVIDDGHGMDDLMIRLAVLWGGTHRENDRTGFGRYGYGLPSASVSQGRRFTVYSKPVDGKWNRVTVDLDDIKNGKYTNSEGRIVVPPAAPATLPDWLEDYLGENFGADGLEHGTIVEIEKVDRLRWKTASSLERNLLEHFGITYRNFLREVEICVNGKRVEPCDPLFLTPGFRFYDIDSDRAVALPPLAIEVKDDAGTVHIVKARFAHMPPTFQLKDKASPKAGRGNLNPRFAVMKDHNGIIVLRNGRQIDVLTSDCPWTTFMNNDRNWGVEVDFPAGLDEEFSITTSKQQTKLSDRMWNILREAGVFSAIKEMRSILNGQRADLNAAKDQDPTKKRPSEQAMEESIKYKTRKPGGDPQPRVMEAEAEFRREVERRASQAGVEPEKVEPELRSEVQGFPYKLKTETMPGAPFFRMVQMGGQKVLYLNQAHRFYTDIYAGERSSPSVRAALEVLLFVIGDSELDSGDDRRLFYQTERAEWSARLNVALDRLSEIEADDSEVNEDEVEAAAGAAAREA
jgi:hypothetical protein